MQKSSDNSGILNGDVIYCEHSLILIKYLILYRYFDHDRAQLSMCTRRENLSNYQSQSEIQYLHVESRRKNSNQRVNLF